MRPVDTTSAVEWCTFVRRTLSLRQMFLLKEEKEKLIMIENGFVIQPTEQHPYFLF